MNYLFKLSSQNQLMISDNLSNVEDVGSTGDSGISEEVFGWRG